MSVYKLTKSALDACDDAILYMVMGDPRMTSCDVKTSGKNLVIHKMSLIKNWLRSRNMLI